MTKLARDSMPPDTHGLLNDTPELAAGFAVCAYSTPARLWLQREMLTLLILQGSLRKATPTSCADATSPPIGTSASYWQRRARSSRGTCYGRGSWGRSR